MGLFRVGLRALELRAFARKCLAHVSVGRFKAFEVRSDGLPYQLQWLVSSLHEQCTPPFCQKLFV